MKNSFANWYQRLSIPAQLTVNLIARFINFWLMLMFIELTLKEKSEHKLWVRLVAVLVAVLIITIVSDWKKIKLLIKRPDESRG